MKTSKISTTKKKTRKSCNTKKLLTSAAAHGSSEPSMNSPLPENRQKCIRKQSDSKGAILKIVVQFVTNYAYCCQLLETIPIFTQFTSLNLMSFKKSNIYSLKDAPK